MRDIEKLNFGILVGKVLSVSREEMQRRETEYRAMVEANPKKRGPKKGTKRKTKASASPVPGDQLPS